MYNEEGQIKTYVMLGTIIMLLVIFSGITYAFFTASNNQGSTSIVSIESGKMLITYNDGTDNVVPVIDIQPSNNILVNKTFSLTGKNTATGMKTGEGLTMPYKVGLKYTSTFSDGQMHYYIKEMNRPSSSKVTVEYTGTTNQTVQGNSSYTGYSHGTLKKGTKYTEMVTGAFPASTSDQTITFNLILQFPDTGENQDSEKGATINGKVVVNEKNISEYISSVNFTENGLKTDDTTDKNIRYVGDSPRNYITFNNETWRIIGVFNDITTIDENGNEKQESLVKIIRDESLGEFSWDSSSSDINDGYGINEWSQADLMYELNCDGNASSKYCREDITDGYLSNLTSGTTLWYNFKNNTKMEIDDGGYYMDYHDYSKNIKSSSIDKIATVRWNLGSYNQKLGHDLNIIYNAERGTEQISNPSDGVTRTNYWDGKIGLMYTSDFGYASTTSTCGSYLGPCGNNNWLNKLSSWTLSHYPASNSVFAISIVNTVGYGIKECYIARNVYPTLFLKSDIMLTGGTGEESNPYILD